MIKTLACESADEFGTIPAGAKVLGIWHMEMPWEYADRCTLGVIGPQQRDNRWRTVVQETLEDGPVQSAFLQAVRENPDTVWIVTRRLTFETLGALALLQLRAKAAAAHTALTPRLGHVPHGFAHLAGQSGRYLHGWDEPCHGPDDGYSFDQVWKRIGFASEMFELAPIDQLARWGETVPAFPLESAVEAAMAWIGRDSDTLIAKAYFSDPAAIAVEAARAGNWRRVLQAATQRAAQNRYLIVEQLEAAKVRPEPVLGERVALLDFRGLDREKIPSNTALVGFCVAPIVVQIVEDARPGMETLTYFSVFLSHERHFDAEGFRRAVGEVETGSTEWVSGTVGRIGCIWNKLWEKTSLTKETLLALVERFLRKGGP